MIHDYNLCYKVRVYMMHDTLVIISKVREYTGEVSKHIMSSEYITAVYATRL